MPGVISQYSRTNIDYSDYRNIPAGRARKTAKKNARFLELDQVHNCALQLKSAPSKTQSIPKMLIRCAIVTQLLSTAQASFARNNKFPTAIANHPHKHQTLATTTSPIPYTSHQSHDTKNRITTAPHHQQSRANKVTNSQLPIRQRTHITHSQAANNIPHNKAPTAHKRKPHQPIFNSQITLPQKSTSKPPKRSPLSLPPSAQLFFQKSIKQSTKNILERDDQAFWSDPATRHIPVGPTQHRAPRSIVHPTYGQDIDELSKQLSSPSVLIFSDDDFPQLPLQAPFNPPWDSLDTAQKIDLTLIDVLAASTNISVEAATKVLDQHQAGITNVFDQPDKPEVHWSALSDAARRLIDLKYALKDCDQFDTREDAFFFANQLYPLPPNPATFIRMYSDVLNIRDLADNSGLVQKMRAQPSAGLRILLSAETPQQIHLFFTYYQQSFLQDPQTFDCAALLHDYISHQDPNRLRDHQSDIVVLRNNFKRILGFDQVCQRETPVILRTLNYDGISGPRFRLEENQKKLTEMPIFSALDDEQQQALRNYVQVKIGTSTRFPSGSLAETVDTLLTRFPGGAGTRAAGYPGDDDAFFNLMVALHMAASNGAQKIDPAWSYVFWRKLINAHKKIPGLLPWLNQQLLDMPGVVGLKTVATIANAMRELASATPYKYVTPELIAYARELTKTTITTDKYGGKNWQEIASSLDVYLHSVAKATTLPASVSAWALWLQDNPTEPFALNTTSSAITPQPDKKYSANTLAYVAQMVDWPDGTAKSPPQLEVPQYDLPISADFSSADERDIPAAYYSIVQLARSGYANLALRKNDRAMLVKPIHNESRMTTVLRQNHQLLDDNWRGHPGFNFAQMFAENTQDGSLYSSWPAENSPSPSHIMIGGRRLSEIITLRKLTTIFGALKDFSHKNAGEVFDQIFVVIQREIDLNSCDARAHFIKMYEGCWLFQLIANEALLRVGKWKIVYENDVYTDYTNHRLSMLRDDQLWQIPHGHDMTGTKHGYPAYRLLTHEWLHIFLQQNDPPAHNLEDQGLIVALSNYVLHYVDLMTTERRSYYQPSSLLPVNKRFEQFRVQQWVDQYIESQIAALAPAAKNGAVFCQNAGNHITVKNTVACLFALPRTTLPYYFLLANAITVAPDSQSQRHLHHLTTIYRTLYDEAPLFARLVRQHKAHLIGQTPWRYIYLRSTTAGEILQSHRLDHDKRTVSLYDTRKYDFYYMTANGLAPLNSQRQALYIMLEIMHPTVHLSAEEASLHRGELVAMADICLRDTPDGAVPATMAATVHASDVSRMLQLAKNQMSARQYTVDEDFLIQKKLANVKVFWQLD